MLIKHCLVNMKKQKYGINYVGKDIDSGDKFINKSGVEKDHRFV